jgi:hypothetical protein
MRNVARILAGMVAAGAVVLVCCLDAAQPASKKSTPGVCPTCCPNPQSPRRLTAAELTRRSTAPKVTRGAGGSVIYTPRPGVRLTLNPCSQHYHCYIENFQACPGQVASDQDRQCPNTPPQEGSWVEIHTAYHNGPAINPLPEDLSRCTAEPVVVVGYHAKVTSSGDGPPVPIHFGPPAAEWSGSSTGVKPERCLGAAFWSFTLGCRFTVSPRLLAPCPSGCFTRPDGARKLQPPAALSHDLTHIVPPAKSQ